MSEGCVCKIFKLIENPKNMVDPKRLMNGKKFNNFKYCSVTRPKSDHRMK